MVGEYYLGVHSFVQCDILVVNEEVSATATAKNSLRRRSIGKIRSFGGSNPSVATIINNLKLFVIEYI